MKLITVKAFEELVAKDEALIAKAKEIAGEGEEKAEKIKAFAASLGYELVPDVTELSTEEMEKVAGGSPITNMIEKIKRGKFCAPDYRREHVFVEERRESGFVFDTVYYRCANCNYTKSDEVFALF